MNTHYTIPDLAQGAIFRREDTIRRSRFLVSLMHTAESELARQAVQQIRSEYPDASHNCWAFTAGPPGHTAHLGYSDDGEPHGTAGRPMLTVLLHSGIGELCAVVTRYFGGVKLGTGGLVRAYQSMVQLGLDELPTRLYMPPARIEVIIDYNRITQLHRMLPDFAAQIEAESFGVDAVFHICLPEVHVPALTHLLTEMTEGAVLVHPLELE